MRTSLLHCGEARGFRSERLASLTSAAAQCGFAIRAGHHCTQPLHAALSLPSSARASCHVYSSVAEVDALTEGVREVAAFLADALG